MSDSKKKIFGYVGFYALFVALCFLRSLSTYVFIVPNGFAPGGISGIASIIYNAVYPVNAGLANTWLNPAVTVFVLNVPLLFLAFKMIDKKFAFNTTLGVIIYAGFMALFSAVNFPQFAVTDAESGKMILAALAGGVTAGVSLGFMLLMNVTVGGTDIIGKVMSIKKPVFNTNWFIFIFDSIVVLFSGVLAIIGFTGEETPNEIFVAVATPVLYSFITLYVTSKVADLVGHGAESSVVFNIITDKYDEVSEAIVTGFHRGVTVIKGEGFYTHSERHLLLCVVRHKQIMPIKRLIKKIDPNAFLYITNTREVNGQGFKHNNF